MKITNLFVDTEVLDYSETRTIIKTVNAPWEAVESSEDVYHRLATAGSAIDTGKRTLYLSRNRGKFIRPCPGTDYYTCCSYMILHFASYCTMDCSYCILQSYFHPPVLRFFVNHDDLKQSLADLFRQKKITRIGTGEFTDSLIWETIFPFSKMLVSEFSRQSHAVLELKTKTVNIDNLLPLDHNRKTIISWSLNTERIVKSEERKTSPIGERLSAAAKCQAMGYPVAFHFDPLVIYPGCEQEYQQVIRRIFSCVSPENITWISLGTFRYIPTLKSIIEKRFPRSNIIYGEFVKGLDGKMRYFKPLRIRLYQAIISCIRQYAPDVTVYFCMEDDEVWVKTMGFCPSEKGGLPQMLDRSVSKICGVY